MWLAHDTARGVLIDTTSSRKRGGHMQEKAYKGVMPYPTRLLLLLDIFVKKFQDIIQLIFSLLIDDWHTNLLIE